MRKGLQKFLAVILVILMLAVVVDVVLVVAMDVEYITSTIAWSDKVAAGENTFDGLGVGIGLVFIIIFGAPGAIVSVLTLILSSVLKSRGTGKLRTLGLVCLILSVLCFILLAVATPAAVFIGRGMAPNQ